MSVVDDPWITGYRQGAGLVIDWNPPRTSVVHITPLIQTLCIPLPAVYSPYVALPAVYAQTITLPAVYQPSITLPAVYLLCAGTFVATVPDAPLFLKATAIAGNIVLTWTAPTGDGGAAITAYKVYEGSASGSETLLATVGNVLTYTDTAAATGQTRYYKVSAVNSVGESAKSNEASAIVSPPLAGLILWLAADKGVLNSDGIAPVDGDPVKTWTDQSGAGNSASQAAIANMPTYKVNIQNGKPVLRWNGINSHMDILTGTFGGVGSIFAVAVSSNGTGYQRVLNAGVADDRYEFFGELNNDFATFFGNGLGWNDIAADTPATPVVTSFALLELVNDGVTATPYVNGVALNTKAGSTATAPGANLGTLGSPGDQFWNGDIAEILVYSAALSSTQRQQAEGYLKAKWGTP